MSRPIDLVWNPNALRLRSDPRLLATVRAFAGDRVRVHETGGTDELDELVAQLARDASHTVALCGGDGTYMAFASALERAWPGSAGPRPVLALLPGGTVSTVARNFGLRGDLLGVLRSLLSRHARGTLTTSTRPTLRVADGTTTRIGFMFGTALVANFFGAYYATGASGYLDAARIVARVFLSSFVSGAFSHRILDPMPMTITADGRELAPRAYSLVLASTVKDVGLHMWVCHRAAEDPTRPHLVAAPMSPRALGPQMPRVLLGRSLVGRDHFDDLVEHAEVRFDGEGPYVLDGDVFRAPSVTLSAGPVLSIADYD